MASQEAPKTEERGVLLDIGLTAAGGAAGNLGSDVVKDGLKLVGKQIAESLKRPKDK